MSDRITDADRLTWLLAVERARAALAEARLAQGQVAAHVLQLRLSYGLAEGDEVNPDTGAITRRGEGAGAGS